MEQFLKNLKIKFIFLGMKYNDKLLFKVDKNIKTF